MPYITREDGVRFVIPSYRDVLIVKKSAVQKEVMELSQSYGEYITMQVKGADKYEVAFSTDAGYSLGETVWHYFNRPMDMIYCEAIPNTSEVILVIVKGGSVYLDGSFPAESVQEELVIFLTQQNNFEIYVYGDVPISEKAAEGKFSFESASVKSYKVLDESAFKNLPLLKAYHFQLVDAVLKQQGIGVFPVKQIVIGILAIGAAWFLYSNIFGGEKEVEVAQVEVNPYQGYVDALESPSPDEVMNSFVDTIKLLYTAPGWNVTTILYKNNSIDALMRSSGNSVEALQAWCAANNLSFSIKQIGVVLSTRVKVSNRPKPKQIYKIDDALARFVDNLSKVYPGNTISLGELKKAGPYSSAKLTITLDNVSPLVLTMIGDTLKGMPATLNVITMAMPTSGLNGTMDVEIYGSN